MIYGYHRNQVKNQRLDIGKHAIEAFCKDNGYDLEKIYTDYVLDKNYDFPCYAMLKEEVLQAGDILIITELERLGCNKRDIPEELQYFKDNILASCTIREQNPPDDIGASRYNTRPFCSGCISGIYDNRNHKQYAH